MVKILIGNLTSRILGYLEEDVNAIIDTQLSYSPPGARYAKAFKDGKWDGVIRLYKKSYGQYFNTGVMSIVEEILKENNVEYCKVDERIRPEINLPDLIFTPFEGYEERDYQQFTLDRAYKKTRGILKVGTGGGKTLILSELISRIKTAPCMFYVLTKDLMEQAYESLSLTLNEPIGRIGGGKYDIQKINICTVQTAVRAVNLRNKKFKISDYQFDEEDVWDKKDIEDEDKLENLKKLLRATKVVLFDECITGDTAIMTDLGFVRVDEIEKRQCRYVLSYDGIDVCRKQILKFMDKGKKPTICLNFSCGEIKCTVEHLIYTQQGWKEAGKIKVGDNILFAKYMTNAGNNTTWESVSDIGHNGEQLVYDIEVEDTHCFFANGFLVHNCHHASAKTCQDVMSASPNAFWRYGCSATPYREDGAEIVLQSLFGRKIVDISSSYLINNGFLAIPHIIFDPIEDNCKLNSYQQIYKECVSGNDEFNTRVVNIAEYLIEKGLSVLILVSQYNQGDYIKALLKSPTNFVTGRMNKTLRQESLDELKKGVKKCIIGTTLFDEGIDVPRLDAVLMAGGGASATRVYQRIGRTLRLKDGKDRAIAIYFHHDARYLDKHARKAKKIMKEEPAFIIKQSKGGDFIFDDIDEVYGFKSDRKNLFQSMSE